MPFAWRDLLSVAERLAADGDEASSRSAIGRAYYAAYHAAARYVRQAGLLEVGHSHRTVWAVLTDQSDAERSDLGLRGAALKRRRTEADYRLPFPGNVSEQAGLAIQEGKALVQAIDQLR